MHILIIPFGLMLWYLAYDTKPKINDELNYLFEEKNIIKRNRLVSILKNGY